MVIGRQIMLSKWKAEQFGSLKSIIGLVLQKKANNAMEFIGFVLKNIALSEK